MDMPERLEVMGVWYLREDALPTPSAEAPEPWEPLKALCREHGIDCHKAYDAVRAGELDARMPSGARRGLRCRRSEFARWKEARMVAWQ